MPRRGRVKEGYLDERRAYPLMAQLIADDEERLSREIPERNDALFEEAADAWLEHLRTEKRAKPSTLANYKTLLVWPTQGGKRRKARIMCAFGGRRLYDITTKDVRTFLAGLDREDLAPRSVNIQRQVLHAIFEFARREESFDLPSNPAADTSKRPEDGPAPIEPFEPQEIRAIAAAARAGLHRRRPGYKNSACASGSGSTTRTPRFVMVWRAVSANEERSTKSRRYRVVPLAAQACEELERLRTRRHFLGRDDHVCCRPDGGPLDRSAMRSRFVRAEKAAGVRCGASTTCATPSAASRSGASISSR